MSLATISKCAVWCSVLLALAFGEHIPRSAHGQSSAPETRISKPTWPTVGNLAVSDRDWLKLSDLNLSDREFKDVERITAPWIRAHCPQISGDDARKRLASLSSRLTQLKATGSEQLVVNEMGDWEGDSGSCPCRPNLNCHTWILNLSGDRVTTLLEYSGFGLVVLKASSHGFVDIVTASNAAPNRIELEVWRFDGERYAPLRCASKRYSPHAPNDASPIDEVDKTGRISEHPCELSP